ncbi:MAG: hypothetical protein Q9N67_07170 [Ghiorsea sp.]|nr:hypothetical protein [Ghiorsea sp.]
MAETDKWKKPTKAAKATQVAFEFEQATARHIHSLAAQSGLTPSSQIRKMIGLSFSPPKRPRLTVSLSVEDYAILGKKYGLDATATLDIRKRIMLELMTE